MNALANDKITIDDLADAIGERLTVYQSETAHKVLNVTKKTMRRFVKITKQTAPRQTADPKRKGTLRAGTFARAIRSTVEDNGITGSKGIWYVGGKEYRLTHLLEFGHKTSRGNRTKAEPHIAPAAERIINEYVKGISEIVRGSSRYGGGRRNYKK